jgi:lipopolysaccharide/colanic/teichoic acid biosynthesis glycosyltransferase
VFRVRVVMGISADAQVVDRHAALPLPVNPAFEPTPPARRPATVKPVEHDVLRRLRRDLDAHWRTGAGDWARAAVKRTFDIVVSALLLLVALPICLAVAIAIKLDSPGPVFYRAERVGFRGRRMAMLKFRKMRHDARGPALTAADDLRFTRVGAWLTRVKADELPQLWNVLRGDMSLIGPRPEDPRFVALHVEEFSDVLRVRPGITGLSQIAFAEESRILDDEDPTGHYLARILPQKLALDRLYATRYHLRIDLAILAWTAVAVLLRQQVAVHRQTGRMNVRRRPARAAESPAALTAVPSPALGAPTALHATADRRESVKRAAG